MGRLLGCIGCFFKGTDHILTQIGERNGKAHELHLEEPESHPHPIRERNGKAPWLRRLQFQGPKSYPRPIRLSCFFKGTDPFLTQEWEGFLDCMGCLFKGNWLHRLLFQGHGYGRAPWLHRLLFPGHRSYPHPIRERNGKAPWLHGLLFQGHRSYPHLLRKRNGKAPWLHGLLFPGHRSYPHPIRERNGKAPWLHQLLFQGRRPYSHPMRERNGKAPWLQRLLFQGHRSYPHPIRERNGKASLAASADGFTSIRGHANLNQVMILVATPLVKTFSFTS